MLFNNAQWVKDHSTELEKIKDDYCVVSEQIKLTHPHSGTAFQSMPKITGNETISTISTYADAPTIVCYDVLGNQLKDEDMEIGRLNETGIGNIAYIALNHPSFEIKLKFREKYEKIMAMKREQSNVCNLQ